MQESRCAECGAELHEPSGEPSTPCPVCGNLAREITVQLHDGFVVHDGIRGKAYKPGSSKFYLDTRSGASYYRKGNQWHHLVRVIDRENDRYVETIRVLSTGELISHVEEPLSEHYGHGGGKNQGGGNEP